MTIPQAAIDAALTCTENFDHTPDGQTTLCYGCGEHRLMTFWMPLRLSGQTTLCYGCGEHTWPTANPTNQDVMQHALAAAAPHLRAEWEQELARAVKRLPWNGVTHGGTMVPLDAVLALLEGGGE